MRLMHGRSSEKGETKEQNQFSKLMQDQIQAFDPYAQAFIAGLAAPALDPAHFSRFKPGVITIIKEYK